MELHNSFGGWIPVWIIGAPLLIGLIEWMKTPKPHVSTYRGDSTSVPIHRGVA